MVEFLVEHVRERGSARRVEIVTDEWNNVFIPKGITGIVPCVAAHIDTVQLLRPVEIVQQDGILFGIGEQRQRTGCGADDKAGVWVVLSRTTAVKALDRLDRQWKEAEARQVKLKGGGEKRTFQNN